MEFMESPNVVCKSLFWWLIQLCILGMRIRTIAVALDHGELFGGKVSLSHFEKSRVIMDIKVLNELSYLVFTATFVATWAEI